jgi:ornithine cyclodeaminase/alanine dehydrogenase-like protein (mu-crystallin family)
VGRMYRSFLPVIDAQASSDLAVGLPTLTQALEAAFVAAAEGRTTWRPKATVICSDGTWLVGTFGRWPEKGLGIFHSIAGTTPVPGRAGPHYRSFQLLTAYRDVAPLALVGDSITSTMLPACVTLLTARRLARADSAAVAFVGAGAQAVVNLEALIAAFPIKHVHIASRTSPSAAVFATLVRTKWGLYANTYEDHRAAAAAANIIVTNVPNGFGSPSLDPAWAAPGTFVSAVDFGRSWQTGFAAFDRIVTDDLAQAVAQFNDGRLAHKLDCDTELPALMVGQRPGRQRETDRVIVVHPRNLVGVLALTAPIYERWKNGDPAPIPEIER